ALGGAATAGRQVWLQNIPPEQLPSCLPSLEYMMEALPFQEIVRQVLHGTADCAEVGWTLFGMSLPEWSLLAFVAMILFALFQLLRRV
ncbi:disulfide bond formation protein B, partial [Azotobacter chroococcum]|nr:disulfide bond formation protein B [Azotobacter chroococcum]